MNREERRKKKKDYEEMKRKGLLRREERKKKKKKRDRDWSNYVSSKKNVKERLRHRDFLSCRDKRRRMPDRHSCFEKKKRSASSWKRRQGRLSS